jgi:hypothetical protein
VNAELKTKWIAALRSGTFKQACGTLMTDVAINGNAHCCLGVLCEVAGIPLAGISHIPAYEQLKTLLNTAQRFPSSRPGDMERFATTDKLVQLNDFDHADFTAIADFIEVNVDTTEAA